MPFVKTKNIKIYYEVYGHGQPVLLVPGGIGDKVSLEKLIPKLKKEYKVIIYDRRNSGKTIINKKENLNEIELQVKDILLLLNNLKIKKTHIIGHSYGASITLIAAIKYPHIFKTVTCVEPQFLALMDNKIKRKLEIMKYYKFYKLIEKNKEKGISSFVDFILGNGTWKTINQERKKILISSEEAYKLSIKSATNYKPSIKKIRSFTKPILLPTGELTRPSFKMIVNNLNKLFPNSKKIVIPSVGHGLFRFKLDEISFFIKEFLNNYTKENEK